jgi:tRNA G26 N,N-dimethylase Trm1
MKQVQYEALQVPIKDTKDAPKARGIFYECKKCGDILSSIPKHSVCCKCGNICIDKDMNRLWVGDFENFSVLKRMNVTKGIVDGKI